MREANPGENAGEPGHSAILVEQEKPEQDKPERYISNGAQGLDSSHSQNIGTAEVSLEQEQGQGWNNGKAHHPELEPPGRRRIAPPEEKTQDGNEAIDEILAKEKLAAFEPLVVERSLGVGDRFRAPDEGSSLETTPCARIVGQQWGLPHAHGEDATFHPAERKGLRRQHGVPDRARLKLTKPPDERSIPINFICIVDERQQNRELRRSTVGRGQCDGTAIPGKTRIASVALLTPRSVSGQPFPAGVVESRSSPGSIITNVELARVVEGDRALAEVIDDEREDRSDLRACLLRVGQQGGEDKKHHASHAQAARGVPRHGVRIPGSWVCGTHLMVAVMPW